MIASRGSGSEARVKPRRSQYQITASMVWPSPRLTSPGQDALAGGAADIGIEQVRRGVAQRMHLDDAREGELQLEHAVEVAAEKPPGVSDTTLSASTWPVVNSSGRAT